MAPFFKLHVFIEPDRIRFLRFANEAVERLGGSVFAAGPAMAELLGLLRDCCGRSDSAVEARLALDDERLLANCSGRSLLLAELPEVPDTGVVERLSEHLRQSSESTDPELLKRRNRQIKEEMERFVSESERQKAEIEAELDRKKLELQHSIKLAETDSLTGLLNRGAFDRRLRESLIRAQRQKEPLTLLVLDLDHFKEINDAHGHQFGDGQLCRFADALREAAREGVDQLCRIGGDEFAAIVYADVPIAERIGEQVVRLMDGKVSVGIAALRPADAAEDLVARADGALYSAKEAGRGCAASRVGRARRNSGMWCGARWQVDQASSRTAHSGREWADPGAVQVAGRDASHGLSRRSP